MLLPSDVARLVLGYLQQEKLMSTCRSFIAESPNLKEYAEHHTEEGSIPGCLLSLFGKNLTTILNEYIAMKTKENRAEIPFMVSSLWKKLDLTLSQIRSIQESAAFNNNQRARTRKGINDRLRQRMLTSPLAVSGSPIHQTSTPIMANQYILRPVHTPGALPPIASSSFGEESTVQNSNSTSISIVEPAASRSAVCTQRKPPPAATASPMRRKQDVQRRRRAAPLSSTALASEGGVGEDGDSLQGIIDGDFPQMVIDNAREKILSNKSLQEKLAENINKFLGSDSTAQSSKQADGTAAEQDPSIDEILGLQGGEMHMSEEAIHDILTQTELDPDFQELYDLFACVTAKAPKMTPRDSSTSNNDPKNVTEKGKKQDVVERVLDVESDSAPCTKKGDVCSKGKDGANLPDQYNGKSLVDQTSQLPSTSKQACANEKHGSETQTSSGDGLITALISIQSTDGDTAMDTSIGANVVIDSEIENMEIKEGAACGFLSEDVLLPNTVAADKAISTESLRIVNEEPKDILNPEVSITGTPSEEMLKDTSKSDPVIPPQTNMAETPQKEKDNQVTTSLKQSPLNRPCAAATDQQVNAADPVTSAGNGLTVQNTAVNVELTACSAPETATLCSPVTSTSQPVLGDSSIVNFNIITEDLQEDAELDNAVNSINVDNYASIILSPLVKSQDLKRTIPTQENAIIDLTDSSPVGEQAQLEAPSTDGSLSINAFSGDCTIYSISGTSNSTGESNVIQIMPATSSTFAPTGNIYINSGPTMSSNIVMLSNSSASSQKQPSLFQSPPRPGSIYTVGQTMSPKLPQGSTIILASAVQPVLQGVMGMFPVSLVGQKGTTFTAPTHQILRVPISKPIVPKLPLPPRSHKPALLKPAVNTGKSLSNSSADSLSGSSSSVVQRLGNQGKRSESDSLNKPVDTTVPDSTNAAAAAKELEAHRRVLCFDGTTSGAPKLGSPSSTNTKSKKTDKNETAPSVGSSSGNVSTSKSNMSKENKKSENAPPSVVKNPKASTTSASTTKDQATEKRPAAPSGGTLGNKENVLQVETGNQRAVQADKRSNTQESEKNVKRPQETSKKPPASLPNILRRTPQKAPPERVCPTSPLVKQASQLLQGMQFQSPTSKQSSQENLPLPSTPGSGLDDKPLDNHIEQTRTPTSKRYNEDGGTPKPMLPPATPDMPTCSPASEAGSENSVNMAAHTLMILSRASLAKSTGNTPLKDNTQQLKSSKSTSKKRKLEEAEESERQSNKREHLSPSTLPKRKKAKKHRKKSEDSFPAGMDVDKFLMSLHYDE
ncbi:protein NPAT isoform X2 [Bufo gargarizans]|uniref:protein NPAT isoform X2 n=1 Tax=Bufo gargarizans TaxID=30331 RepID=UPI001CF39885|nr:protein NPAT isoform X2 [Bufo gargarizans]